VQFVDLANGNTYTSLSSVPSGDPYATVYTFVTQASTVGCNASLGSCGADARRVILAAQLQQESVDSGVSYPNATDAATKLNYPTYSTTVFTNPAASNQPSTASGLSVVGLIP